MGDAVGAIAGSALSRDGRQTDSRNGACPKSSNVSVPSGEEARFVLFLKKYWVEILIVVGLILAVFLLFEQMNIRGTLLGWAVAAGNLGLNLIARLHQQPAEPQISARSVGTDRHSDADRRGAPSDLAHPLAAAQHTCAGRHALPAVRRRAAAGPPQLHRSSHQHFRLRATLSLRQSRVRLVGKARFHEQWPRPRQAGAAIGAGGWSLPVCCSACRI